MTKKDPYNQWLKKDYGELIELLEISELQKHFMRSRWLDQVMWLEAKCKTTQRWYYVLRLVAIVGGILVPALIGKEFHLPATVLSLIVAVCVATEEFFHFGERWRHYRQSAELLKIQGWRFFQLSGPYQSYASYGEAYPVFAGKVEEILQNEVNVFISEVVKEKKKDENPDQ